MSVTYVAEVDGKSIAFFSLLNDSLKREGCGRSAFDRLRKLLPGSKSKYKSYPAVKIGRLGVSNCSHDTGVGSDIILFLKYWFTHQNKTGCRFMLVDAYNNKRVLSFYEKNKFVFLTSNDEKEKTRLMYFDLRTFQE